MARYLIVAHQTAESPELHRRVKTILRDDAEARFTLLVPATPVKHLLTWDEGETREIAERMAERAAEALRRLGAEVTRSVVGSRSPALAIEDEIRDGGDAYDQIVICTLPIGISRWLKLDVVQQAERRTGLPVVHVEATAHAPARP